MAKFTLVDDEPTQGKFTLVEDEQPGIVGQVGRQLGLTARAGVKGVAALPNMVGGALVGEPNYFNERLDRLLDRFLPKPEGATERVVQDVASSMAGSGASVGAGRLLAGGANAVASGVGNALASGPGVQTLSGAAGAAAGGSVREGGGSPLEQFAASLAASVGVPAAVAGGASATRGIVRGGEAGRQRVENNLKTFDDAGTTPTVGQATESRGMRAVESGLAKMPGGAGPMAAKATAEASEIGVKVDDLVGQITPRSGSAVAGREIKSGVKGFVDSFRAKTAQLYDDLDNFIPAQKPVEVPNTRKALEDLNADIPGAPALSEFFKNAKIRGIQGALESDVGQTGTLGNPVTKNQAAQLAAAQQIDTLPYEAIKKLRTLVGNEIANTSLVSDVPRSKWKTLYAALSEDLGMAAQKSGKDAQRAFDRANTYHRVGIQRIDDVLDSVVNKGDPEDIFRAAISGTREGASTIWGVMRSLPKEARNTVAGTMLKRFGIANPSAQNDLGEAFSTETFLTNWNKVSDEAKLALFGGLDSGMKKNIDQIAKAAANIREGSRVFQNPSGTSQAENLKMGAGGIVLSLLLGRPDAAGAIAGGMVSANAGARLFTNPNFVRWLADSTKMPAGAIPGQINALTQMAARQTGEDKAAMLEVADALRETQAQTQPRKQGQAR